MNREPLAIIMTVITVLVAVLIIWLARLADVSLEAALALAGVIVAGNVAGVSISRSRVTPVD